MYKSANLAEFNYPSWVGFIGWGEPWQGIAPNSKFHKWSQTKSTEDEVQPRNASLPAATLIPSALSFSVQLDIHHIIIHRHTQCSIATKEIFKMMEGMDHEESTSQTAANCKSCQCWICFCDRIVRIGWSVCVLVAVTRIDALDAWFTIAIESAHCWSFMIDVPWMNRSFTASLESRSIAHHLIDLTIPHDRSSLAPRRSPQQCQYQYQYQHLVVTHSKTSCTILARQIHNLSSTEVRRIRRPPRPLLPENLPHPGILHRRLRTRNLPPQQLYSLPLTPGRSLRRTHITNQSAGGTGV